jgi:DNA-binding transcriptional regulator YhcF (GntR family)
MDFHKNRPIYLQIVDHIVEQILLNKWSIGERVPSVRELGSHIEVNPNTVMRAYRRLEEDNILYNLRGIGFFVSDDASKLIMKSKKSEFLRDDVPAIFDKMELLGLNMDTLKEEYKKYLRKKK